MQALWERAKQVFAEAIELDPAERREYIDSACGSNAELKSEVERLLANDETRDDILQSEPATVDAPSPVFARGEVLAGRFEIVRLLGRGGMGEVYEALDRQLNHFVALKTVLPELLHSPRIRDRFKREILIARRVSHRNICRIYDLAADQADHRHAMLFSMELLEGETLAGHLQRKGRLATEEALPLVRQMAAGLAALHEEKIVHRDFKPGNVMLVRDNSGETQVKITDFGLARPTAPPSSTPTASSESYGFIGTPPYMAPEQLAGERAEAPADIYALGLVMYEMVTGKRPYLARTIGENLAQKQAPPASPSDHVNDLDPLWSTTILHCLQPRPEDRPATVDQVVDALEGKAPLPVPGKDDDHSWWKWVVERREVVALLVFVSVMAVLVALFPDFFRSAIDEITGGGAQPARQHVAVLPLTVSGTDPELRAFADGLMEEITRRLSQFEGLNEELLVAPPSLVREEEINTPLEAQRRLGVNYAVAGSLQSQGDRLRLTLTLTDNEQRRQVDTALSEGVLSDTLALQDAAVADLANMMNLQVLPAHAQELGEISPLAPGVHEFYTRARGYLQRNDQVDQIDNAIELLNRAVDRDSEYALAYAGLGEAYWYKYERTEERAWVENALVNCKRAVELDAREPQVHVTNGRVQNGTGEYEEAIESFQTALRFNPRSGEAYEGLARSYEGLKRPAEAEAAFQRMINLRRGDWRAYKQLGNFYFTRGEHEKAAAQYQRVVELSPDSALGYANLGSSYYYLNRFDEARKAWERSVELEVRATAVSNLASLLLMQGDYREAARRYEQATKLQPNYFRCWGNLAAAYHLSGDDRAAATYARAFELAEEALRVNPRRTGLYSYLAHFARGAGHEEEAKAWLAKAVASPTKDIGELVRNAATYESLGLRDDALEGLRRAVAAGATFENIERRPAFGSLLRDPRYRKLKTAAQQ